jgi:hypothetical protein
MPRQLYTRGTIGADTWTVYKADPDDPELQTERPGDAPHEGITLFSQRIILIRNDLPANAFFGALGHEAGHAAEHSLGLAASLRLNEQRGEIAAQGYGGGIVQFLKSAGMLKGVRVAR